MVTTPPFEAPPRPGLPFTGLQVGLVLAAGLAAGAGGLVLRRAGGEPPRRLPSPLPALGPGSPDVPADEGLGYPGPAESSPARVGSGAGRLVRCEVCGGEFDPSRYQIVVPGSTGTFDTIECASRSREGFFITRRPHAAAA